MATQVMKYRCRKCRQFLFDDRCVVPSHGAFGPCQQMSASTLWYLDDENYDFLPRWIQKQINQGCWTKGKILCPKCKGRLGSYDYIAVNTCSCGVNNTPNIQICKSRVDANNSPRPANQISQNRDRMINSNLVVHNHEAPSYERSRGDANIHRQGNDAVIHDIALSSYDVIGEEDVTVTTNSQNLLEAGVSHFQNIEDRTPQHEQNNSNTGSRASVNYTTKPRTHKSMTRQGDPLREVFNFIMQEKSTQTSESIESIRTCSAARFRQSFADILTDTELQELQDLRESLARYGNRGMSVNELSDACNAMQRNCAVQTVVTAVPLITHHGENQELGEDDTQDGNAVHDERQMSRRRKKNRLRYLRRRAKKRGRLTDVGNTFAALQDSLVQDDTDSESETETYHLDSHCCPVCLDVFFKPHVCQPCKHIFCDPCLRQLARGNPTTTPCPLCREIIRHVRVCKDLDQEVRTHYHEEYVARRNAERRTLNSSFPLPGSPERGFWTSLLFREPPPANARTAANFYDYGANLQTFPSPNPQDMAMNGFYDVPRGLTLLGVTLWMGICFTVVFIGYAIAVLTSKKG